MRAELKAGEIKRGKEGKRLPEIPFLPLLLLVLVKQRNAKTNSQPKKSQNDDLQTPGDQHTVPPSSYRPSLS